MVLRDSFCICLLITALIDLDLQSADIENNYLTAPWQEKIWTKAGTKIGKDEGRVFIIVIELYGFKSSGVEFWAFFADQRDEMGFESSIADPDVWIRPVTKPDGEQY